MNRRDFQIRLPLALGAGVFLPDVFAVQMREGGIDWRALERRCGGRLGVAVLHPESRMVGHRMDERFPMCSTFKWVAAALTLQRVDLGQETLERRVRFDREALLAYAPVAAKHVDEGMTVAQLCEAAVAWSDNTAANLLLEGSGGPAAVTKFAREHGDAVTRLDRNEPKLNESRPGDPRDTTSPGAMARLLHTVIAGNALKPDSRARLVQWMMATETNKQRLRADLPAGWRMGSKTGTGARGSTNDVGFFYPPGDAPPIFAAVYITGTSAALPQREGVIADVARSITR